MIMESTLAKEQYISMETSNKGFGFQKNLKDRICMIL